MPVLPLAWAFLSFLFFSQIASALPRYAVQEGVHCMSCHVSPTGAGKRNGTGGTIFEQDLSLQKTRTWLPEEFSGNISSFFSVGGDLRTQNRTNLGTSD